MDSEKGQTNMIQAIGLLIRRLF